MSFPGDRREVLVVCRCRNNCATIQTSCCGHLRRKDNDEFGDDDAVAIACVQELYEFVTRKLRRYPLDAIAVAASSFLGTESAARSGRRGGAATLVRRDLPPNLRASAIQAAIRS
jgi:hypothetical protein